MKKALFIILLLTLFFGNEYLSAENVAGPETKASVKELFDFHEVIAVIWHEAWPAKDIEQLKNLLPEVEKGVANISNAALPGILRDKKDKWDAGVKDLVKIAGDYKDACIGGNAELILTAAENLHMQFERLVRIIKPAFKELDNYHVELYQLYHYYMPDFDYEKIKASVANLNNLLIPLMKADIPKRVQKKSDEFNSARNDLKFALDNLIAVVSESNDKQKIETAIEKMHTKYQMLDKVFE